MRLLRAEWAKLTSVRGTWWLLAAVPITMVGITVAVTLSVPLPHCPPEAVCVEDTVRSSLGGVRLAQVVILVLAAAAISAEYETRLAIITFAATPRRLRVFAAKAVIVTAVTAVAATVAVAGSLALARFTLPYHGFTAARGYPTLSLTDRSLLRAGLGTAAYLCLIALLSLGIGAAIRSYAATTSIVLGLLFLFPLAAMVINSTPWQDRLHKWGPMDAGLAIQNTLTPTPGPVTPWHGLGILALWTLAALIFGAISMHHRDVGPTGD